MFTCNIGFGFSVNAFTFTLKVTEKIDAETVCVIFMLQTLSYHLQFKFEVRHFTNLKTLGTDHISTNENALINAFNNIVFNMVKLTLCKSIDTRLSSR